MRAPLALAVLSSLAAAPAAQLDLARADGVLGSSVEYQLSGEALALYALVPSQSQGPTPLAILDPLDPRSLNVGLDLLAFVQSGVLSGAGTASVSIPLPLNPGLQGLELYAQAVTVPGSSTLVGDISNPNGVVLQAHGTSAPTIGDRAGAIDGHSATLLDDGRVLLAGGVVETSPGSFAAVTGFEVFDPQTQSFAAVPGTLPSVRQAHLAVKLGDGRVLLIGGASGLGAPLASCDIYDPATGVASPAASMSSPRLLFSASLLPDGRVLVAGGLSLFDEADPFGTLGSALASTELYNPASNTWSPGPALPVPLTGHQATTLGSGRVLITGGTEVTQLFGFPFPAITDATRRFDPATSSFLATAALPGPRSDHGQVSLPSGRAVIAGGQNIAGVAVVILATTAVYDEGSNAWFTGGSLVTGRAVPQLVVAGSNLVVQGGASAIDALTGAITVANTIERAPLNPSVWTPTGSNLKERLGAICTAVDGGERVLTTGTGTDGSPGLDASAELYVP